MTNNGEQTVTARIAITREIPGKHPAHTYVIQLTDDASGELIGEARMNGDTFAKVITGHVMIIPVSVAGPAARQRYGLTENTIRVTGFERDTLDSPAGEAWLNAAREALASLGKPPHDVSTGSERGAGLLAFFTWWTPEAFTSEEIVTLKSCIPAIPAELAKVGR